MEVHEGTAAAGIARFEVPSAEGESEAQRIFFAAVGGPGAVQGPDVEELCRDHPRHASDLRLLHAHWKRARAALGTDWREPAGIPGRYRVIGRIAAGGMGDILSVWDPVFGRLLAMKVLRSGRSARENAGRARASLRLLHEARILGRLQHPSIVPVHEMGKLENGEPWFTMLHVRGLALSEILPKLSRAEDGWTLPRAIRVLLQVCEAVAHAHSQGVLHRDLKPGNVMVGPFGETYVMDWGLAKARDLPGEADLRFPVAGVASTERDSGATPLLTMEGEVLGTPAYIAPEQARGRLDEVGPRSDVYSAGAILYHLLAGEAPFGAGQGDTSPREVLERVLAGPPAPLERRTPRVPAELVAICDKAMGRDPDERYGTMLELAGDLRAWLEMRVVRAHESGAWAELRKWMRRHTAVVGLLGALLVLLVGSAVSFGVLYRKAEVRRRQADLAQADSLRRQDALRPMAPWSQHLPSFRDDFEDGFLDRRWIATGRTDLVSEERGRLRLEASADGEMGTNVILDPYVNVIRGDFEASVAFFLEGFEVARFGTLIASFGVDAADDGSGLLSISRRVQGQQDGAPEKHWYSAADRSVESDDAQGRFRLTRAGERISAYYWRDGWQELCSEVCTSGPVRLHFEARSWPVRDLVPFAVEFDDFEVRTSYEMPSKTLTALQDDFSDGAIDSRLVIRADAGIAAELDGRLLLEKLPGRAGMVAVELGPWNWVLRGDFSVSFGFELPDFPGSADDDTSLSLILMGVHGGDQEVHIVGAQGGHALSLGEVREPLAAPSGKLRMERRGALISYQIWRDGWQELGSEYFPKVDCTFRIELASSAQESLVVAIDDLEATSMIRRGAVDPQDPTAEEACLRRIDGPSAGAALGVVSAVGDMDRDGCTDFAAAACGATAAGRNAGQIWIRSGRDSSVLATFQGLESETLGKALAGAGDVDADGYPDLIAGAPSFGAPLPEYAQVFSGRSIVEGAGARELHTFACGSTEDEYGLDVAGVGDVDGDGHDDVFVGARERDGKRGAAFLYSGRDGSELLRLEGEERGDRMGQDAACLGDIDGDGIDDFAVGAAGQDPSGRLDAGRVHVLLGGPPGRLGRPAYPPLEGDRRSDCFGVSVARAGDVDGDGIADLVVGACGQAEAGAIPGYARAFSGRDGRPLWTARGRSVGDYFGRQVESAGDVNGDGVPDVLVTAVFSCNRGRKSGMAQVLSGRDGTALASFDGAEGDGLGSWITGLGDVDGDGLADLLVSASGADPGVSPAPARST